MSVNQVVQLYTLFLCRLWSSDSRTCASKVRVYLRLQAWQRIWFGERYAKTYSSVEWSRPFVRLGCAPRTKSKSRCALHIMLGGGDWTQECVEIEIFILDHNPLHDKYDFWLRTVGGQSIKKPNIWNSQTAMVALYSGDFKLYSDTSSIMPPQLVIEWRALDWVCV